MGKKINNISFVIPVFNEGKRLDNLFEKINFFNRKYKTINSEFIFVNDGSVDDSKIKIKKNIIHNKKQFKFITYNKNKGKGFALKKGVSFAKKDWILTIDADLSTDLEQIIKWNNKYKFSSNKAYWGSRALSASRVKTKILRKFIGILLFLLLKIFNDFNVKDTQCGFKLYHRSYAKKLFKKLNIYDFSHDIKLLILLSELRINIKELPIIWKHVEGSKVNVLKDGIIFFLRILKDYSKK